MCGTGFQKGVVLGDAPWSISKDLFTEGLDDEFLCLTDRSLLLMLKYNCLIISQQIPGLAM